MDARYNWYKARTLRDGGRECGDLHSERPDGFCRNCGVVLMHARFFCTDCAATEQHDLDLLKGDL